CVGEAVAESRRRVPSEGPDVRTLLADRPSRADAARSWADVPPRDPLSQASPIRERSPPPRFARLVDRTRRRRARLRHWARHSAARAPRCSVRRWHCALLRPRHVGNGRVARPLFAFRCPGRLGEGRRDPMNRAVDVAAAGAGLAIASPVLAAAAVAIKLDDGGPVFYRQGRVGLQGREFELLKLRTMDVGAEKRGAGFAVNEGDPRITRVGRFLRRLSIDELPQLWNVVRGDMSL